MKFTTSKGRSVESDFTEEEAMAIVKTLPSNYAQSLVFQYTSKGKLSPEQWVWIHILAVEASAATVAKTNAIATAVKIDLTNLDGMFATVSSLLKYPELRFVASENCHILLQQTNKTGKRLVYVKDANEEVVNQYGYGKRYSGKIEDGAFLPAKDCPAEILPALIAFSADPLAKVKEYGKVTGHCCFCSLMLSTPDSLHNGYGEKCARNYNLPYEKSPEAPKKTRQKTNVAVAVAA